MIFRRIPTIQSEKVLELQNAKEVQKRLLNKIKKFTAEDFYSNLKKKYQD